MPTAAAASLISAPRATNSNAPRTAPGGGWIVELNQDTLPRVLVNQRYYARVTKEIKNKTDKEFVAERFHSANWLVKSLHQRAQTA